MTGIGFDFDRSFEEMLAYFRQKGYAISAESWRDVWKQAHARAFTVARITAIDVLEDIRKELAKRHIIDHKVKQEKMTK